MERVKEGADDMKDTETQAPPKARRTPRRFKRNVATILVLLALGTVLWISFGSGVAQNKPKADRYQAVFLDNGQVFFGKLKNTQGAYLKLENAYYSKSQELPADATDAQKAAVNNNVSLVQVGKEVYGPENSLNIKAEQVLFWQDLQKDSKVSKAILSASN